MSRKKRSHAARCARAAACAALATLLPPLARAADGDIVLPLYDLPAGSHAQNDRPNVPTASERSGEPATRTSAISPARPTASFALVEIPPEASMPGGSGYKRPHHAVGYRWQAAESWMRDHGFDARTCYLPMVRMHTKLAAGGSSGTLWVYGRCTFR